jgi:hypothetical protein
MRSTSRQTPREGRGLRPRSDPDRARRPRSGPRALAPPASSPSTLVHHRSSSSRRTSPQRHQARRTAQQARTRPELLAQRCSADLHHTPPLAQPRCHTPSSAAARRARRPRRHQGRAEAWAANCRFLPRPPA